ncbi:ABC transporter permease [Paenibacillus aceris]|uniref:Simple sugar transport system permease protein n=1 Tax=Paenibacillus aceris TaxID=869555 RepID=A0ABS4HSN6_9BACL|nr:ABC transporter permease [Paenibacillus aceris]MBP1961623.1 simple sugar transport system permease protein [Paenibacillus aceris]NHW37604.1 ABC transporter permease [Paenibacillus aceris]
MQHLLDVSLFNSMIRMVAPILLAALGGAICSRVGLFNVGLEGFVLVGAFSAIVGNFYTGNVVLAVLIAVAITMLFSLIFAYISIHLQANVIVVGISFNFLALGLTAFCLRAIFHVKGAFYDKNMIGLPKWNIPFVKDIPVIGEIISGHSPLVYLAFILVFALQYFLFKSVLGFRLIAVGENPVASKSLGIKVNRMQYLAVLICGLLCGLAGAQLSLGQVTMFTEGMTAGRGFIALVATMLGQANPIGVMASSLLFGLMDAFSIRLQGFSLPTHFTQMLPYVVTLLAMLFFRRSNYLADAQKANGSSR